MSAEWVTAIATAGTFVVIAASAIAALVQLRHMRGSNQIAALTELRETMESSTFQNQMREIRTAFKERLRDPNLRNIILTQSGISSLEELQAAVTIGNFFENAGALVKHRIIDGRLFCDLWSPQVQGAWAALEEFIANRRIFGGPALYENFEYLVVLTERYLAANPHGTFPAGMSRKTAPELWPESERFVKS